MPFGAIAAIAGPIIGGMLSGDAAQSAADTQAGAARYAADLQNQRYQQTRTDLMPYMQMGPQALSNLEALMGFGPIGGMGGGYGTASAVGPVGMPSAASATAPGQPSAAQRVLANVPGKAAMLPPGQYGNMTVVSGGSDPFGNVRPNMVIGAGTPQAVAQAQAQQQAAQPAPGGAAGAGGMALGGFSRDAMMNALQANPAYQFNLQQGMDAINKASAARGMYYAPATLQGLGSYAQGMASQEYGNIWNRLFNMAGMGQNAATQTGQFGANAATNMGNMAMQGANAQAAGIMGQNQAYQGIIGGVTGALNNPNTSAWLNSLYGGGSSGMGTGWDSASLGSFYP